MHTPASPTNTPSFIHGGAWRDPNNTHADLAPTVAALPPTLPVAGLASLDYRLSPHPSHPQPASTPAETLRSASHPSHIRDVRAALAYLHAQRGIDGYILAGHSVGATLAFQLLMGPQAAGPGAAQPPLPRGILGLAGIYEFRDFASRNGPAHAAMVEGAMGARRDAWDEAAPLCFRGSYAADWPEGRHVVLSYSPEDSLVDGAVETEAMLARLRRDGRAASSVPTHGEHDFVWQDGKQIASLITYICERVK